MLPFIDLTGLVFGRLTVVKLAPESRTKWICLCSCGKTTTVKGASLRRANKPVKSCGCYWSNRPIKHGELRAGTFSPECLAYHSAKNRCQNPNNQAYARYGGRGIEFRFNSVQEFIEEIGRKPSPKHSLDRIDNNGHYEKGNVKWATPQEQMINTRSAKRLTYKGTTKTVTEWAMDIGLSTDTLSTRIRSGKWCVSCAVTLPLYSKCLHYKPERLIEYNKQKALLTSEDEKVKGYAEKFVARFEALQAEIEG